MFTTQAGSNRVSAQIVPAKGGYWPKKATGARVSPPRRSRQHGLFSADNDRVSASGSLIPSAITVTGVDLDGQWLNDVMTAAEGPGVPKLERKWQLAHASPKGGYIVEEVTRTILGTKPDGSPIAPSSIKYWQAWQVSSGSNVPAARQWTPSRIRRPPGRHGRGHRIHGHAIL